MPSAAPANRRLAAFVANLKLLAVLVAVAWAVEVADWLLPAAFDYWGIRPRVLSGLIGIPLAPFLHGDFSHLISNTVPFLLLGGLVLLGGRELFLRVSLLVILLGGFAVWLLAPSGKVHIGASGLVFGYLGFLLSRGIYERHPGWVVIGLLILLAYGGLLWGLLPGQEGISWQGHLAGFLAGILAARLAFSRDHPVFGGN